MKTDITPCNQVKKIMYYRISCQLSSSYCSNTVRLICILLELWAPTALIFTMTTFRSGGLYWRIAGCYTEWRTGVKQKWRGPLRSWDPFVLWGLTSLTEWVIEWVIYIYAYLYISNSGNMYININMFIYIYVICI